MTETLQEKRARIAARVQSHDTPMEKTPEQLAEERRIETMKEEEQRQLEFIEAEVERLQRARERAAREAEKREENLSGAFNDASARRRPIRPLADLGGRIRHVMFRQESKKEPERQLITPEMARNLFGGP